MDQKGDKKRLDSLDKIDVDGLRLPSMTTPSTVQEDDSIQVEETKDDSESEVDSEDKDTSLRGCLRLLLKDCNRYTILTYAAILFVPMTTTLVIVIFHQ